MNFNYIKENIIFEDSTVIIADSGPGAIELLMYNLYKDIKIADVVVYDTLVNQDVLNFSQKKANLFLVEKLIVIELVLKMTLINGWLNFVKKSLKFSG